MAKILDYAVQAPSGENCQPWAFAVDNNVISVFNRPESDQSLYNFRQRGSLIAHGALLENMVIAAESLGFTSIVELFPETTNPNMVARVHFERTTPREHPLFSVIRKRTSNRKVYSTTPLTFEQRASLLASGTEETAVYIVNEPEKIKVLAGAVSTNERLIFENKLLHDFFFGHIRWTDEENKHDPTGFYIKTLELSPQETKGFRLIRHWPAVAVLNKLGLSKKAAAENAKKYLASGAMGIITIGSTKEKDFVAAGRVFERLWLTATKLGLGLQPLTGLLFLKQKIVAREVSELSAKQVELIEQAYTTIQNTFALHDSSKVITLLFRVGEATPPTARSGRSPARFFV